MVNGRVTGIVCLAMFLLGAVSVVAQECSERRQVAVFRLSYYGEPRDPVPESETFIRIGNIFTFRRTVESETTEIFQRAVGAIDEQILSVFINMGRFDLSTPCVAIKKTHLRYPRRCWLGSRPSRRKISNAWSAASFWLFRRYHSTIFNGVNENVTTWQP